MKRLIAAAFSTLGLVSTVHALGLERPELGMKETLGVCPTKQDQTTCSLLDLKGRVKHVVLKGQDTEEFYFDQKGVLTKRVHPRGGTFERTYDARGRLVSEKVGTYATQYEYGATFLARKLRTSGNPVSFDIAATADGGRKMKVTDPVMGKQVDVEFDGKGRIVSGSADYARVYEVNPEGPFHCEYADLPDGGIRSTCKGRSELGVEYGPDKRLRALQFGPSYRYTFTYPETDARGNWLVRMDNTGQKLVRQVEYWD